MGRRLGPGAFALSYDAALVHLGTNDENGVDFDWSLDWVRSNLKSKWEDLIAGLRSRQPGSDNLSRADHPLPSVGTRSAIFRLHVTHNGVT